MDAFAISSLAESPDLINAAIFESGGGRTYPTVEQYEPYISGYVRQLGCNASDVSRCDDPCGQSSKTDSL